jgi:hypothetical protein
MTPNQIVYDIKNILAQGRQSDDFPLSDRQVLFIVNSHRASIIRERKLQGLPAAMGLAQTLSPIDLIKVDETDSCFIEGECTVLRSKDPIPQIIEFGGVYTLTNKKISLFPFEQVLALSSLETYNKHSIVSFIKDNYLYIVGNKLLKWVKLVAIFGDPMIVLNNDCNQTNCKDPFELEYPMPEDFLVTIKVRMQNTDLKTFFQQRDLSNDAKS